MAEIEEQVTTRSLTIVDSEGNPRITMGCMKDGSPRIEILAPDDEGRIVLTGSVYNPAIAMMRGEKAVISMSLDEKDDCPAIGLFDPTGQVRLTLKALPTGGGILVTGGDGKDRVIFSVGDNGVAGLTIKNADGRDAASMGVTADGVAGLNIYDLMGRLRARTTTMPDGGGCLRFINHDGNWQDFAYLFPESGFAVKPGAPEPATELH